MSEKQPYGDWPSLSRAIKEAAKKAVESGAATDLDALIRQAYCDRFLTRVFAAGEDSEWLLKGGVSMLTRVPKTRAGHQAQSQWPGAVRTVRDPGGLDG